MLQGKVAFVSGASRGIGAACALELGKAGATVIGTATDAAGAERIRRMLAEAGIAGDGVAMNLSDGPQVEAVVEQARGTFGDISILVNNAGVTRDNLLVRMTEQDWDTVMEVDLKAVYRLSRLLLRPMMKARYGRIINISSVVGVAGNAGQANYAAAKAGMIGFARALAREVASRNITVNCVAPGFIDTDMTRSLTSEQRSAALAGIPLGRFGRVEDVAAAVLFLASPGADYMTGCTLHVNGGMHME